MTGPRAAASAFVVKLALAGAALAALGHVVAWDALAAAAAAADYGWAALAIALLPLNVGLEAYRFHRLLRSSTGSHAPSFSNTLAAVVGAYPLGLLTPGRLGDYAGRAIYLRGIPASITTALTFIERTATLACCVTLGTLALPLWLAGGADRSGWLWLVPAGTVAALLLVTVVVSPAFARRLVGSALPFARLRPAVHALGALPPAEAKRLLGLSFVRYAVFSTQFVLLVRAFAGTESWAVPEWGAAAGGVTLVFFAKSAVPGVTLGDLGVREGAAVFFLASFGEAAAFNASLGLFAINLLVPGLLGLTLVTRLRFDPHAEKQVRGTDARAAVPAGGGTRT